MRKKLRILITAFCLFLTPIIAHSFEKKSSYRSYILGKYLQYFSLEKSNQATDMAIEIFEMFENEPIENFYGEENINGVFDKIFLIGDKYKDHIPLYNIDIELWESISECSIQVDILFQYKTFSTTIHFFIHKIKELKPKCPEAPPKVVI